jgi:zinc transport system substrate-binding protein
MKHTHLHLKKLILKLILKNQVNCLFKEPQFNAKILDSLIQSPNLNQNLKVGILDPLGKDEDMGPDGYFRLINNLAESFNNCFN